jgi:hypothetical protein
LRARGSNAKDSFRGGDADGLTFKMEGAYEGERLVFDGFGGHASPRGTYERTEEVEITKGEPWSVWRHVS